MPTLTQNRHRTLQQVLRTETFASVLLTVLFDQYGTDLLTWTRRTIKLEVHDDFQVELSEGNLDRLMAGIGILTSDAFYQSLPHFITYCNVLSGDNFDPTIFEPADVPELAWGLTEALLLSPPDDGESFNEDILHYIGAKLRNEGFAFPPDVLQIALFDDQENALQSYADDPDGYAMFYSQQREKTDEINLLVRDSLLDLLQQIESLPLTNGKADALAKKLRSAIRAS